MWWFFDNLEKVKRGLSPENWTRPLGRVGFSRLHPPKTIDEVVRCGDGLLTTLSGYSGGAMHGFGRYCPFRDLAPKTRVIANGTLATASDH